MRVPRQEGGLTAASLFYVVAAVLVVIGFAASLTGCGTSSANRMQALEQGIDRGVDVVEDVDQQIPKIQDRITDLRLAAQNSDLGIAAKAGELLAQAEATLETLLAKKSEALASIEAMRETLTEVNSQAEVSWHDELQVLGEGVGASAPLWGTHSWLAALIGGLLGVPALIFGAKKNKQAQTLTGALPRWCVEPPA